MRDDADDDPTLAATVAAVWRQARVSCPHPDLLSSWLQGGVDGAAARFLAFHLGESDCPACNAGRPEVDAAGVRALRSTLTALRSQRG
jgi:hypothetical protein